MKATTEIITRMRVATKSKNDAEMLVFLGLSSGTAANWKRRGEVPMSAIKKTSDLTGCEIGWLLSEDSGTRSGGQSAPLDRELMQEAIITIGIVEDELGIKLKPEKRAELVMMIYDEYAAGVEVETAKVILLVKLAA